MIPKNEEMPVPFVPLASSDSLDELFKRSNDGPVILFKHSLTCPISGAAYQEMQRVSSEVSIIVIQHSRDISSELEKRTGIRHESPQVIILRRGAVAWSASHWAIKANAVESAFRESV